MKWFHPFENQNRISTYFWTPVITLLKNNTHQFIIIIFKLSNFFPTAFVLWCYDNVSKLESQPGCSISNHNYENWSHLRSLKCDQTEGKNRCIFLEKFFMTFCKLLPEIHRRLIFLMWKWRSEHVKKNWPQFYH